MNFAIKGDKYVKFAYNYLLQKFIHGFQAAGNRSRIRRKSR